MLRMFSPLPRSAEEGWSLTALTFPEWNASTSRLHCFQVSHQNGAQITDLSEELLWQTRREGMPFLFEQRSLDELRCQRSMRKPN